MMVRHRGGFEEIGCGSLSVTTCGEGGVLMHLMGLPNWDVEKH